jgi:WD40 repeat protein
LATTIHSPQHVIGEPATGWGIAAAWAGRASTHVRLDGHTGAACGVCSLTLPDGRIVLASASDDGTIRLWDPGTATPIGTPMRGNAGTVEDICVLTTPDGRALLASAGGDGTVRLWDPATGHQARGPLTGHTGRVWGVCVVPGLAPDGRPLLASTGADGTVRLWDPGTGHPVGGPLTESPDTVNGLAPCISPAGECLTVTANGIVRAWTAATASLRAVPCPPRTSAAGTLASQDHTRLLTGDAAGKLLISDLAPRPEPYPPVQVDDRAVLALCLLPGKA